MRLVKYCITFIVWLVSTQHLFSQEFLNGAQQRLSGKETTVWIATNRGMVNHRILGLVRGNKGTLLSFTEARYDGKDEGPHDLVCKRSTNNGKSWGEEIFIEKSDGSFWKKEGTGNKLESWANPAALLDATTGRIFIFYVLNEGVVNGVNAQRMSRVFYRTTDDEGHTWSNRVEITDVLNVGADGNASKDGQGMLVKNEEGFACDYLKRAFHMPGPGHGIQLKNGRLLLQFWHRRSIRIIEPDGKAKLVPVNDRLYSSSVIYSDDHGKTWKKGGQTGLGHNATEARVVELADGTVMMNARMHNKDRRWIAFSKDGGLTWINGTEQMIVIPHTSVDCGLISVPASDKKDKSSWLLYSHPDKKDKREGLTVSLSKDAGKTWISSKTVFPYGVQYSDLVKLKNGYVGLLYEKGDPFPDSKNIREISFVRFKLKNVLK